MIYIVAFWIMTLCLIYTHTLKMEAGGTSENYQNTWCHTPLDHNMNLFPLSCLSKFCTNFISTIPFFGYNCISSRQSSVCLALEGFKQLLLRVEMKAYLTFRNYLHHWTACCTQAVHATSLWPPWEHWKLWALLSCWQRCLASDDSVQALLLNGASYSCYQLQWETNELIACHNRTQFANKH